MLISSVASCNIATSTIFACSLKWWRTFLECSFSRLHCFWLICAIKLVSFFRTEILSFVFFLVLLLSFFFNIILFLFSFSFLCSTLYFQLLRFHFSFQRFENFFPPKFYSLFLFFFSLPSSCLFNFIPAVLLNWFSSSFYFLFLFSCAFVIFRHLYFFCLLCLYM